MSGTVLIARTTTFISMCANCTIGATNTNFTILKIRNYETRQQRLDKNRK